MGRKITGVHTWGRYGDDYAPVQLGSSVATIPEVLRKVRRGAGLWHTYHHEDNGYTTLYYNTVKGCWLVVMSDKYTGSAEILDAMNVQARQRNAQVLVNLISTYVRSVDNALQLLYDRDCDGLVMQPWKLTCSGFRRGYQSVKRDTLDYGVDARGAYIKCHRHSELSSRYHICDTYRPRNYVDAIASVCDYIALDTMPEAVNYEP